MPSSEFANAPEITTCKLRALPISPFSNNLYTSGEGVRAKTPASFSRKETLSERS